MKLFFLRNCPIWNFQIPAQSVEDLPEWIAKKLINGGVATPLEKYEANRAKRKTEKEAAKAKPIERKKKGGKE